MDVIIGLATKLISDVGNVLLVPLILFCLSMIVGIKFSKALRAALITAVALTGIYTILDMFLSSIAPVAQAISGRMGGGMKLDMVDIGWPACFAAGLALPVVLSYVMIGVVLNLILVLLGRVKTLQINMVEPIMGQGIIGYAVYIFSGNYFFGLIACLIVYVISLKLADWQAPKCEEFFGFKGIALVQVGVNEWGLLAWPISKLLDKIPVLREGRFTPDWVTERFGVLGEPMFIGAVFGIVLGILGGYEWTAVILLAITLAAALNLMPRMVGILMEGLIPIQEGVRDWLSSHAKGRQIYIGMDPALGTGHASILSTVMLMIPVTLLIAIVLPGNRVLPLGDLATLTFTLMFCVVFNKGDIVRSAITSAIVIPFVLWGSTMGGPYIYRVLQDAGMVKEPVISVCMFEGGQPYWWPLVRLFQLLAGKG